MSVCTVPGELPCYQIIHALVHQGSVENAVCEALFKAKHLRSLTFFLSADDKFGADKWASSMFDGIKELSRTTLTSSLCYIHLMIEDTSQLFIVISTLSQKAAIYLRQSTAIGGNETVTVASPTAIGGNETVTVSSPAAIGGNETVTVSSPAATGGNETVTVSSPAAIGGNETVTVSSPAATGGNETVTVSSPAAIGGNETVTVSSPAAIGGKVEEPTEKCHFRITGQAKAIQKAADHLKEGYRKARGKMIDRLAGSLSGDESSLNMPLKSQSMNLKKTDIESENTKKTLTRSILLDSSKKCSMPADFSTDKMKENDDILNVPKKEDNTAAANTTPPFTEFGYPDPIYLSRVQEELAAKGITEKDLSISSGASNY